MFEFIQAKASDRDYLLTLRKRTMTMHLERSGQFLSPQQHEFRLDDQYHCSFLVFHLKQSHLKQLIGTVKFRSEANSVELMQIQIDPEYQNKGHGSDIIKQILRENKTVKLTVLKGNQAFGLYKRLGFKIVGADRYEYHMQFKREPN